MIAIVGVAAGAVLLLALPLGIAIQRLYRDDEVLKLERNATAAARGFDARSASNDPVEFGASSDQLAAYGVDGDRLGGEGPVLADAVVGRTLSTGEVADVSAGGKLVASVPVLGGERVVGAIRASRSTSELDDRVLTARLLIGGAALLIIALAALAAVLLSRRLARPLRELAGVAAAVGDREPAITAPRSGVAELDVVAEALNTTVERLDDLVRREREFTANASHQIRTPLAALRLELDSRELDGNEVGAALEQVDRLERTVDTLLAATRDAPVDRRPFAVDELLDALRSRWVGPLGRLGRALVVQRWDGAASVIASRAAVEEAIDVLIDNGQRHGAGTVTLRARPVGGQLALDVSDEGRITERPEALFVRSAGKVHGIGLALARSLVEAEGGRLDLTSTTSGPTTFTVLLRAEAGT